jgi:antitoxin YefM
MATASYSQFREHLAEIWDKVEDTQEPVIVSRRGHQDMVILPADELESLRETAHLMRSPKMLDASSKRLPARTAVNLAHDRGG